MNMEDAGYKVKGIAEIVAALVDSHEVTEVSNEY